MSYFDASCRVGKLLRVAARNSVAGFPPKRPQTNDKPTAKREKKQNTTRHSLSLLNFRLHVSHVTYTLQSLPRQQHARTLIYARGSPARAGTRTNVRAGPTGSNLAREPEPPNSTRNGGHVRYTVVSARRVHAGRLPSREADRGGFRDQVP